jgi:hypothetical protein
MLEFYYFYFTTYKTSTRNSRIIITHYNFVYL